MCTDLVDPKPCPQIEKRGQQEGEAHQRSKKWKVVVDNYAHSVEVEDSIVGEQPEEHCRSNLDETAIHFVRDSSAFGIQLSPLDPLPWQYNRGYHAV